MTKKMNELRPVMTRIPEGLRRKLMREAEQNGRSMNGEIIHRLTGSFAKEDESAMMDRIVARVMGQYEKRDMG